MKLITIVGTASFALLVVGCAHPNKEPPQDHQPLPDLAMWQPPDGGTDFALPPIGGPTGELSIMPLDPILPVVSGQPAPTQQFVAFVGGVATPVNWFIDQGTIGSIDGNGLFATTGTYGGTANVTAIYGSQHKSTTVTVQVTRSDQGDPAAKNPPTPGAGGYNGVGGDGPGGKPGTTLTDVLNGPSTHDDKVSLIYPYDGTVWPRGLRAPLLQWNPGPYSFKAVLVDIKEKNYEYKGYFASNSKTIFNNVPIPQDAWDALTYSNAGDPVTVSVTFATDTAAYSGYTEKWTIARATLKGTIYYNSYNTGLVTNSGNDGTSVANNGQYGAGTLAIRAGVSDPVLVAGVNAKDGSGCRVCHIVSADGKTLLTQASDANLNYGATKMVNLLNDTTNGSGTTIGSSLTYPALNKDGSLLFSSSGVMSGIPMDTTSQLYAMPTTTPGTVTPVSGVTGLPTGLRAMLPVFSPDGAHVAFNFWAGTFANNEKSDSKSLAILDFDGKKTFSNGHILYTPATSGNAVSYSSFLPTSSAVVFELETNEAQGGFGYTWKGNTGELWWVDVASKMAARLDQLNGRKAGVSYLPAGPNGHTAEADASLNFEPTVNPIASGGYAWVVFTSRRMYGNVATGDEKDSDPRHYNASTEVTTKKLWVAAVDLNGTPGNDPSHPAFYLPAQELSAGNARGFWTVDKCLPDGDMTCKTGDECCNGYCEPAPGGGLQCTSTPPMCAAEFEKCKTTADCCGASAGITCINNICTTPLPPPIM